MVEAVEEALVRELVELLDLLTLDVDRAGQAEDVDETRLADLALHELRGQGDHVHDVGEAALSLGEHALLIENVALDRFRLAEMGRCVLVAVSGARCCHDFLGISLWRPRCSKARFMNGYGAVASGERFPTFCLAERSNQAAGRASMEKGRASWSV